MILNKEDAKAYIDILKKTGKKTVFTNGCFDILHRGHISYLATARNLGDMLVVGLNSDASVKKLKGYGRPVNGENDRAFVLDALKSVDVVVIFSEDTAENLIGFLKPDVYAKGGDYTIDTLPEAKIVQSYGGIVELLDFVDGYSTTKTISKMSGNK